MSEIRNLIRDLRDEDRVIVIACHDKEEMEYMADEIIYMKDGKIVKGDAS